MDAANINPDELYPFGQARKYIVSPRGKHISLNTLHRWRCGRKFAAESRVVGSRTYWFIRGIELLKLLQTEVVEAAPVLRVRTPAARERAVQRAVREFEEITGRKV